METREVPAEDVDICKRLLSNFIYSYIRYGENESFEREVTSNNIIIVVHNETVYTSVDMKFFGNIRLKYDGNMTPSGLEEIESRSIRMFSARNAILFLPRGEPFNIETAESIAALYGGFPVGIITDNRGREKQILSLGDVVDNVFGKTINVPSLGEIKYYNGQMNVFEHIVRTKIGKN